jgi:DNA-binding transcriptional LysR family regulator
MDAPDLDPDLLKAFLAVAEHRSFTRAAAVLHRTQSAVSMQIKRLEERLDVTLLHRSKAGVGLTASGEGLRDYARRILALNAEAVGLMRERKAGGVIRLGVMDDYGTSVIPPLLASFAATHPPIRIEVETGLTYAMPARLGEVYDLVIAMHPEGAGGGELLRRKRAVWAASTSCGIENDEPLPVALFPRGCLFRQWAADALDAAGRPWRLAFVSPSVAAVSIAAQGLAVTVMKAGTFPPSLRPLSVRDGMPPLPGAEIRLHRAPNLSHAGNLLADHLRREITKSITV